MNGAPRWWEAYGADDPLPAPPPPRLLRHFLPLRKEADGGHMLVQLVLPVDLTRADAARFARFVGALVMS